MDAPEALDLFKGTSAEYDPVVAIERMMDGLFVPDGAESAVSALAQVRRAAPCLDGVRLTKNMAGLGALWSYFPHVWDVRVSGISLRDKLSDPATRRSIAGKAWRYMQKHEQGRVSRNRVMQSVKAYCGHHVSNFRPVAARDLFAHLGGESPSIFDPCGGWGGRMLGARAVNCTRYVCLDASQATAHGLRALSTDLGGFASVTHAAVEDISVPPSWADVAFTSPPYFDAEQYSTDDTQSWKRYPTYAEWVDGFLFPLINKMTTAVRAGGHVALNIADVRGLPLVADSHEILGALGLTRCPDLSYILSSIAGKGEKAETVMVYQKPPASTHCPEATS